MSDTQHTPIQVKFDGKFTVWYVNSKGEESAFRCTPDVGALFAAAPDLLAACQLVVKNTERAIGDPIMILPIRFACVAAIAKATDIEKHKNDAKQDENRT